MRRVDRPAAVGVLRRGDARFAERVIRYPGARPAAFSAGQPMASLIFQKN